MRGTPERMNQHRRAGHGPSARVRAVPSNNSVAPRSLPEATLRRLPVYLQALMEASGERLFTISSEELAARAGANAAQVRKDLSHIGSYGIRGVGYEVQMLADQLSSHLGLNQQYNIAIVGAGNLGQALGNYRGFAERGFRLAAAFDNDTSKVGKHLGEVAIQPLSALEAAVRERDITVALIATPAAAAQDAADRLVAAGVTSLLNFAPTVLNVGPEVSLRRVDLAVELQILGYYQHLRTTLAHAN